MTFILRWGIIAITVGILLLVAAFWKGDAECNWCVPSYCAFDHDCPDNCACCIEHGEIDGVCC